MIKQESKVLLPSTFELLKLYWPIVLIVLIVCICSIMCIFCTDEIKCMIGCLEKFLEILVRIVMIPVMWIWWGVQNCFYPTKEAFVNVYRSCCDCCYPAYVKI